MTQAQRYGEQIAPLIARNSGATYEEMMEAAGLEYWQVGHGLQWLRLNGGINHVPIKRVQDHVNPWARRFFLAQTHADVLPELTYRQRYALTMMRAGAAIVADTIGAFGFDQAFMRLQIDVERVVQDIELMQVPTP